ncbi:CCA tRNA nucleotidyltransferase [Methanosphaera cuniculi]|nr:CCA tRNA nucleotidyltransferase [Methanosphaera cuniculi]
MLKTIKPSDEQRRKIEEFSQTLSNIILDYAKDKNIDINCRLVGSMAKKTSLINKADIDMFMTFDLSFNEEELKKYGLEFGKHCIETLNGKSELRFASHPYITGFIDGYEIDFVPCYRIKDSSELKSAVDRTILHTDYIQSHLTDEQADEVLLLKKFMSCVNTYGANYKVSGFSGYLCELLILEYKTFENVLYNAANNWHNMTRIDLEEYGTSGNFKDPLIVIDPVDKNRNVAAALSIQKFNEFIIAARNFLEDKDKLKFFQKHEINTTTCELKEVFKKRKTKCYILSISVPDLPTDVIYPQVNKTMNSLKRVSEMYDFSLLNTSYYLHDNKAYIILEYEYDILPDVKIHNGPRIADKINSQNFKNKYPDAFIMNDKYVNISPRKYKTVNEMINEVLKPENMSILKLGKNIKEEIINTGYNLSGVDEFIDNDAKCEDIDEIFLYLHPNYNIER